MLLVPVKIETYPLKVAQFAISKEMQKKKVINMHLRKNTICASFASSKVFLPFNMHYLKTPLCSIINNVYPSMMIMINCSRDFISIVLVGQHLL